MTGGELIVALQDMTDEERSRPVVFNNGEEYEEVTDVAALNLMPNGVSYTYRHLLSPNETGEPVLLLK